MVKVVNARDIRGGWGLNGIIQGNASDSATAFQKLNCRWVRDDVTSLSTGTAQAIATAMVSAGIFDPNPKVQLIISDYWASFQSLPDQKSFMAANLGSTTQNGSKLFACVEGPNEMGTQGNGGGSITVAQSNTGSAGGAPVLAATDSQTGTEDPNIRALFGSWAKMLSDYRAANTSLFSGIELCSPTILSGGQGGSVLNAAPSGLPGDYTGLAVPNGDGMNVSAYVDYGCIHWYQTTNAGGSSPGTPCGPGQSTYAGAQQSYDRYYQGFQHGMTGGSNSFPMVVSECGQNSGGWATDGVSMAWADIAFTLDHFALGGRRILFYTATGNNGFDWFSSFPNTLQPRGTVMANLSTLMSINNNYTDPKNLTEPTTFTPAYTGSGLTVTGMTSTPTTGGIMVCPKSDGSTMIPVWREPSYETGSSGSTSTLPSSNTVTVNFGSNQSYNVWDPMGGNGGGNLTVTNAPTKISTGSGSSVTLTLYASPLFIELSASPPPTVVPGAVTVSDAGRTSTTQTLNWTSATQSPTDYIVTVTEIT